MGVSGIDENRERKRERSGVQVKGLPNKGADKNEVLTKYTVTIEACLAKFILPTAIRSYLVECNFPRTKRLSIFKS